MESDTSTSLERRGEVLPDVGVSHRAGAVVSEFVSSIIEETQARAAEMVEAAAQDAAARQEAQVADAARVRTLVQIVAGELSGLLSDMHEISQLLSGHAGPVVDVEDTGELVDVDEGEAMALEQVRAGLRRRGDAPTEDEQEPPADQIVDAELAPDDSGLGSPDDHRERLARMTDPELARAYVETARAAHHEPQEERATFLRSVAGAAIDEALRRPTFANGLQEPPRRRGRLFRRYTRHDPAFAQLREACVQARDERLSLERSAS